MKMINVLTVPHFKYIDKLQEKYGCKIFWSNAGIDLDFWKQGSKDSARKILGIDKNKFVILVSKRLVHEFQIHQLLNVLGKLKMYDFHCYFSASGPKKYENYLQKLKMKYKLEEKVTFIGHVAINVLKDYYSASDIFFMPSILDAGPGSSLIAVLMEKPIITTNTGLIAETLNENNCGLVIPTTDYRMWKKALEYAMQGEKIPILNRKLMEDLFGWEGISKKWLNIYRFAFDNFYKN